MNRELSNLAVVMLWAVEHPGAKGLTHDDMRALLEALGLDPDERCAR